MAILRRDDTVTNTLGNAIAGAQVYYLLQPADVATLTPLANVYSDSTGTPASNPQITDGFGHAFAYLTDGQLYTIVYVFPNGSAVVYPDQFVGSSSGGSLFPFEGIPSGAVDGTNRVFALTNGGVPIGIPPIQVTPWLNFPLIQGLGYTISGTNITYATAPQPAAGGNPADQVYAQGLIAAGGVPAVYTPVQASTNAGTITGAINGTNLIFALPSVPVSTSLVLDKNGLVMTPNVHYTLSGNVITLLTSAPISGDNLNANYLS